MNLNELYSRISKRTKVYNARDVMFEGIINIDNCGSLIVFP